MAEQCPFLDRNDARCAEHFRVDRMGDALEHCFNGYRSCAIYKSMRRDLAAIRHRHPEPTLVKLTVAGHIHEGARLQSRSRTSHAA